MTSAITPLPRTDNRAILTERKWYQSNAKGLTVAVTEHKYSAYRIGFFCTWLDATGGVWHSPNLEGYRDYLLHDRTLPRKDGTARPATLAPRSALAHLSSIRGRYGALLKGNGGNRTIDRLYKLTPDTDAGGKPLSIADKKALVDEAMRRLNNAVHPSTATVKVTTVQDVADSDHLRLTKAQARALVTKPGMATLLALRNTAIVAVMLCTGVREAELVALDVSDLRQSLKGELALRVQHGKGDKQRLIPYGDLSWSLTIVERWLEHAGIEDGPVFRGMYKGGKRVRDSRIHVRAINQVMAKYPIAIDGVERIVHPHDCRRTYARLLYNAGVNIMAIKDNLGHSSVKTTEKYIGIMDAAARKPPAIIDFDLATLPETLV